MLDGNSAALESHLRSEERSDRAAQDAIDSIQGCEHRDFVAEQFLEQNKDAGEFLAKRIFEVMENEVVDIVTSWENNKDYDATKADHLAIADLFCDSVNLALEDYAESCEIKESIYEVRGA